MNKQRTKMTHHPGDSSPPLASESNKTHQYSIHAQTSVHEESEAQAQVSALQDMCSTAIVGVKNEGESSSLDGDLSEDNGRERLKRHRIEVAGHVWIPDIWGQEEMLKDWVDCVAFDASLVSTTIMSARSALAQEGRRSNSGGLRIENSPFRASAKKNTNFNKQIVRIIEIDVGNSMLRGMVMKVL
ncbi:protein BIC1-like [Pistacia vera]|uniref:protein BIC1-like n=1 Tax=Pistacia vera TaxID=55513 RepID=UPI0012638F71|nr:protein BIC1-like [Pistacia vera]